MKVAWNLILPDQEMQQRLNERLFVLQKPMLYFSMIFASLVVVSIMTVSYVSCRYNNYDQF
jgi:hypothetical protein